MRRFFTGSFLVLAVLCGGTLATAPIASAHVERPSYWPDPKPDCSISPCAGGKVPHARTLASSLNTKARGTTRVVCRPDSMQRLRAAITSARAEGYYERPTVHHTLSAKRAQALLRINQRLAKRCSFHQIQPAVMASGNNDRVVVMPGLYTEPTARKQPTHDPACDKYLIQADSGDPGALSHDFQVKCPNDANLIAVIGRGMDTGTPPQPGLEDRHGIPNVGPCIRCNLQLEGSGVSADDVVVEAGSAKAGNGGPSAVGNKKDVALFVDRADGFVMRNMTFRHAREHNVYILETDGYLFDHFKAFYAGGYGVLTFVEDHGLIQHCDAAGSGDSGIYPGAGADSTDHRYKKFYPKWRFSQTVRYCDSHHNDGGFSGTNSHGTLIEKNNFYDNALGFTTDVFTAPGHPGFPQHGNVVRDNNFYSNNFNPFIEGSDVAPFISSPVGTGLWLAGGNANLVKNNHFYDNWRRGAMLFAVPDATVCGPVLGSTTPVPGCSTTGISTSFDNKFVGNTMGVSPSGQTLPNGQDFWWDSFPGTTGNCWWNNTGPDGAAVNSEPLLLPDCNNGANPELSVGTGDAVNEGELVGCLVGFQTDGYPAGSSTTCTWNQTPTQPSTTSGGLPLDAGVVAAQQQMFSAICASGLASRTCAPFTSQLWSSFTHSLWPVSDALAFRGLKPAYTVGRLSLFTCSWWRQADAAHRYGMVQRIRHYATLPVNGFAGNASYGYGAGMPDARAQQLFEDRCSTFQAGPFALYKIYGAAAPFLTAS